MNAVGMPEVIILLPFLVISLVPVAAGIWALVTLHRIRTGQQMLQAKVESIERLLQRS
jgi:hypothetical protein